MFLDRVGDAVGEHDGIFAAHDFVQGDELLGLHERTGAVVNKNIRDVVGQRGEGVHDGILPFASAAHEGGGRGRVGGELGHLALVAVNDDVKIGDGAGHEGHDRVGEDRPAGEGDEDLVGDGARHAGAISGGEEDGGGATHGGRAERLKN